MTTNGMSRRKFMKASAGLAFAVVMTDGHAMLVAENAADDQTIGAWVRIATNGNITIVTPAVEMGQGSMTGVPIALAEELDANWNQVALEMAPSDADTYGYRRRGGRSMRITGSRAIRSYFDDMRLAGAQVRKVLINAAAKHWKVSAARLTTDSGFVIDGNRRLGYGEIAAFASVPSPLPEISTDELKPASRFKLIGTPVPRRDIPEKVDGSAMFSIDVQLPGMVYATTIHAPVQMATPVKWDADAVLAAPGVIDVVALDHGIAIVALSFEQALAARSRLNVQWSTNPSPSGFDSSNALDKDYATLAKHRQHGTNVVHSDGDADSAFRKADRVFRAEYRSDYAYHAQMEPLNAVVRFNAAGNGVEVWEGTQAPDDSRRMIAEALGFRESQVKHHAMYLGGGFGRRSISDYTVETALIARAVNRPVKMIWTREEDLSFAMFRPQAMQCVEAALDQQGQVNGWRHCVIGDGDRLLYSGVQLDAYYGIDNISVEWQGVAHGIRLKHWRAVAHPFNLFAIESMVDEMAAAEGMDPIAFRRERLQPNERAIELFDRIETMSDWHAARSPDRALGFAISERSGSLAAGVVEISLNRPRNIIRVHRVWLAVDGGLIVQPDMARANIESGVVYGISSVLKERASVKHGRVEQSNFHQYRLLRMSEAPEEIQVEFIPRSTPPAGLGEIGNPFVAAAVANAFFSLTGKRLYHMPFTPERVGQALSA